MGFCTSCGEIVRNPSSSCSACGAKATDATASGVSSKDNRGDTYSNAYLSSGFNSGIDNGLRRMIGADSTPLKEICVECGKVLTQPADIFVGPSGGHVYCEGCYGVHFKKGNCEKCRKPVLGLGMQYVSQEGRVWHRDCFDQGTSCHECCNVIFGEAIMALGKHYHPDCFKCFNCQSHINGHFLDFNGEPCCSACHNKIKSARPTAVSSTSAPIFSAATVTTASSAALKEFVSRKEVSDLERRCDECTEIVHDTGIQLPNGALYHQRCFWCAECGKELTGKYVLEHGKTYHPACRVIIAGQTLQCLKCQRAIASRFIKLEEGVCHSECFTCASCGKTLANQPFSDTSTGPTCEACLTKASLPPRTPGFTITQSGQKEFRGPGGVKTGDGARSLKQLGGTTTCPACGKAVYMSDQVFGPVNTKWHRACLRCAGCRVQLDSMAKMKEISPYCSKCFGNVK